MEDHGTAADEVQGVANLGFVPATSQVLGVDRMIAQAVPQATIDKLAPGLDRVMPGLGGQGGGVQLGVGMDGSAEEKAFQTSSPDIR